MAKNNQQPTAGTANQYTARELAQSAHLFGASPDCVTAALRLAGKTQATREEARKLVDGYCKKEVK